MSIPGKFKFEQLKIPMLVTSSSLKQSGCTKMCKEPIRGVKIDG